MRIFFKPAHCRNIAVFGLEYYFSAQLLYKSALPRQPEFFGKIGVNFRYRPHYPSPPAGVSEDGGVGSADELSEDDDGVSDADEDGVDGVLEEGEDEEEDGLSDEVTVEDDPEEDGAELPEEADEEDAADEEL